jgi:type IV pilus assembly protein PilY1
MSALKVDRLGLIATAFFLLLLIAAPLAIADQPCAVSPASGAVTALPNVLVIFDNSGSMTEYAHKNNYDPTVTVTYAGIFDSTQRYNYDDTGGYFVQAAGGAWSGKFLNWACMLKIDVSRKVMTGGKVTVVSGNKYITSNTYSMDSPERTYNDTSGQTPYNGNGSYKYQYLERAVSTDDWARLWVSNGVTEKIYNIRIKVSSDYTARGILHDLEGKVRLGIMHFNSDYEGGYISTYVKKLDSTQLNDILAGLNRNLGDSAENGYTWLWTYTPLAETLYSATRYFSQVAPYYHNGPTTYDYIVGKGTINDPLYNEDYGEVVGCAKNYVVLLTDGESTEDQNIPRSLRDYDGDGCDPCPCSCADYTCICDLDSNGTAYLDDVAKYTHDNDTDLRNATGDPSGVQNLTLYTVYMFGQPGWADVLLRKAADADHGGGKYFLAADAAALTAALEEIFNIEHITQQAAAAASTAITSESISGTDLVYIPYYKHPSAYQWWGNIRAFRLGADGSMLAGASGTDTARDIDGDLVLDNPKWDATVELQTMNRNNRNIFTHISGTKENFVTTNNTLDKYFDVDLNNNGTKDESVEADALISYIRGTDNPGGFSLRGRMDNYLGDIMNASPSFVGKPAARYDLIYGDTSYWDFYWDNASRTPVLYSGANDGMLHCFDAGNGQERWAYIPYNLLPHLKWLANPNYCHCYYVDLSSKVWDIKLNSGWRSVLVGGMRLGGTPVGVDTSEPPDNASDETLRSALFALDVTDPGNPQFLWEINDGANERFGYTTSQPIPVKVGGTWYLVFGSGPRTRDGEGGSTNDGYTDTNGYIFVVNPNTGAILRAINLGAGNFFGSPVAIDYDLDYSVDMIYIGDTKGNLWRIKTFTESGTTKAYQTDPANWIIDVAGLDPAASNPQPLLSLGADQPILMKPAVTMDEKGRVWIYVGTGRYFCANDNRYCAAGNECPTSGGCTDSVGTRSKYMAVGVYDRHWDSTDKKFVLQGSTLGTDNLDHRVIKQGTVVGTGATGYYVVDATTELMATDVTSNGWYFHLLEDKERCLGDYTLYGEEVLFISFEPDVSDPCAYTGISNLYGVYYTSGTSSANALFDMTGEGTIDSNDLIKDASNKKYGSAIIRLDKGFAGGSLRVRGNKGYTPLPAKALILALPANGPQTGITSWREVWQ